MRSSILVTLALVLTSAQAIPAPPLDSLGQVTNTIPDTTKIIGAAVGAAGGIAHAAGNLGGGLVHTTAGVMGGVTQSAGGLDPLTDEGGLGGLFKGLLSDIPW
ncbi:hypothetical protein P691DRAFT_824220 [Macrolepiota fuliginosa MF-IS2]|uniref:Uncharacterized protein n=1 Tax=Macrolepiota fuliginosa MF-IS2 TaxID=1400762 RepID=A0A9P5XBN6_9AGAR|nr:hypothetical protein P691DRAFT_824220 [Macrolepiota fuliginosa MF-IS2]